MASRFRGAWPSQTLGCFLRVVCLVAKANSESSEEQSFTAGFVRMIQANRPICDRLLACVVERNLIVVSQTVNTDMFVF